MMQTNSSMAVPQCSSGWDSSGQDSLGRGHAGGISSSGIFAGEKLMNQEALMNGEIVLQTQAHSAWGAAVTAWMYLPASRSQVWQGLTDYSRWVQFFPDMVCSEVLQGTTTGTKRKRLYQVARKAFLMFTAQVEIYLNVFETLHRQIQFRLEKGSFSDFSAELELQDCGGGTLLMYTVRATPLIPIPSVFIQQAIHMDLPANLRRMRQVLCGN